MGSHTDSTEAENANRARVLTPRYSAGKASNKLSSRGTVNIGTASTVATSTHSDNAPDHKVTHKMWRERRASPNAWAKSPSVRTKVSLPEICATRIIASSLAGKHSNQVA